MKKLLVLATAMLLLPIGSGLLPDAPERISPRPSDAPLAFDAPEGHPGLMAEYQRTIRIPASGAAAYAVGYRIAELNRARAAAKTAGIKLNWRSRGPGNVGGRTRPLVVFPDDPQKHWWAGAVSGGLWETTDGGQTWKPKTELFPNLSVVSLAMAPSDPNIVYLGTGEGFYAFDGVGGNGIFKTTDQGDTWEHLSSTVTNDDFRFVNRLLVHPSDPSVVTAATDAGIFRSTNGGGTWTHVFSGPGKVFDLQARPDSFEIQIASRYNIGIIRSMDAGLTWMPAPAVPTLEKAGRVELTFAPDHPRVAYATAEGPQRSSELYRSDDGGRTWWITTNVGQYDLNWMGSQGWYDNAVVVRPYDTDRVFAAGVYPVQLVMEAGGDDAGVPVGLDQGGTEAWLKFTGFGANALDGRVLYLNPAAQSISITDYSDVEIRFGQGAQKAHRFRVPETAGTHGNGGEGVPWADYEFTDYVDVPFQVWDSENNRQLMVSFRDQADDGAFDLIEHYVTSDAGTRDIQSHEYLLVSRYDYDASAPHDSIARNGGVVHGQLYFLWPTLVDGATWNPAGLPNQTVAIDFVLGRQRHMRINRGFDGYLDAHVDHHAVVPIPIDPAQGTFWILDANDGGVAISYDNAWRFTELDHAHSGYVTSQFYGVAKQPGADRYIGGTQDNGTWISDTDPNSGDAWHHVIEGDGFESLWHAKDLNKVMGSAQFNNVFRSIDGGVTWDHVLVGTPESKFITTLASSDSAPNSVYTFKGDGVWYSRDFGATWALTPITEGMGKWAGGNVRVSIADSNVVWAGFGMMSDGWRSMHVSKDRGLSFTRIAHPPLSNFPNWVNSGLATHPTEAGTAYVLFSIRGRVKVIETKDYGENWTDLSGFANSQTGISSNGFPDVAVYDLVVMPHATQVLWIGTEIGLFRSNNYGRSWRYAHNGLPAVSIWRIKIRDDQVIVGTHGRGIWTVPLSEVFVGADEEGSPLPAEFSLSENYPNPFNAATTIRFSAPQQAHVRLSIYDLTGRRISVLTDRVYAAGEHELQWNAGAHASGVYFCRMESGGRLIRTRQLTLVR